MSYNYYFERCELFPYDNSKELPPYPTKSELISFLEDTTLHKSVDYIDEHYQYSHLNFKHAIKEDVVLINEDACSFLTKAKWSSMFRLIKNQTQVPLDAINYYVANRVIKINGNTYNMFLMAIRVDIKAFSEKLKDYFEKQIESNFKLLARETLKFSVDDMNFTQCLVTQAKYDNQLFTYKIFNL